MRKFTARTLIGLFVIALAACNTTPPPRPAYAGVDQVRAVSAEQIVGQWQARILNPIQGEERSVFDVAYNADGTVIVNMTDTSSGMNMAFEMTGTWQIKGDVIEQKMESMRETSGNKLASMMLTLAGSMKDKMSAQLNVYEADARRLVLVSNHGQAQEYRRK